jgi:drug/metabolite transporter (DMT)-like permease
MAKDGIIRRGAALSTDSRTGVCWCDTMTERQKALIAAAACVLFWGLSFVSSKIAVAVFPPMTLGALRFGLAVVFLIFIKGRCAPKEKLALRDLPCLFGAGLIGVTLYFFCENNGVSLVTASEASIIIAAIPVLTMAAERLVQSRAKGNSPTVRIGSRHWLGAAVSMIGVALVAGASVSGTPASPSGSLPGYLFMGGAAASWVIYCFLTRPLFARRSRIYIVFWQTVFGFLGFLPFAAAEYPRWGRPDLPVLLHLGFLGICCSALGYWIYARSLAVLGVAVSSLFINFIPVVTVIAGFFILGDRLSPLQWAGAALVLSGVYLAMWERPGNRPGPRRRK